jgi:hypothetical protein
VGTLGMVFRAELRRRWRSWVAVVLLVSIVGGIVLTAAAAGRRTASAFPNFVAAHGFDSIVYTVRPAPAIAGLPNVNSVTEEIGPDNGQPSCACAHPINPTDFGVLVVPAKGKPPFKLVSGHLPNPSEPDQVLASFTLRQDYGVHLGSVIKVPFYAASQRAAYNATNGQGVRPEGPTISFHVVGFEATEFEFPSGASPTYDLYAPASFDRTVLPRVAAGYVYFVRLRHGATDFARFHDETLALAGGGGYAQGAELQIAAVETSIHPQAIGWWLLAALAALVGLVVIGQALARQSIVESEDYPTLAAIGADRRQLVALGMARCLVLALAGAAGAVLIAIALSPIAPLGEARVAEASTGVTIDVVVVLFGALGTAAVVLLLGAWPASRAARPLRSDQLAPVTRPSVVVAQLAAAGAPPTAVVGVRYALERRSGRATVPVGSALLGTVLAVIALSGTAVFGASLAHLTSTPKLYGDPFQLNFSDPNSQGIPDPSLLASLTHNTAVAAITEGIAIEVSIKNVSVGGIAGTPLRGPLLLSAVNGHLPSGVGQIGLGITTMNQVDARLGSLVQVTVPLPSGGTRTVPFRVVSQVSLPVLAGTVSLGTGAVITLAGYEQAVCPPGPKQTACRAAVLEVSNGGMLVSVVPGRRGVAAINYYFDRYRSLTALAVAPTSLINFGEAVNFPLLFGAILAIFGAATLLHMLVVSVARRRQEIGLLKVLGFVRRQVASVVGWQATTLALVGIVIGIPSGVVVGQAVWTAFAGDLGAVPVSVVPVWLIAALIVGVLVVANLIAVGPALVASRSKVGDLLRTQ